MTILNCTAVILTGGESKRMGSDKAATKLQGKPLLEHVLEKIEPLFSELLISVHVLRPDLKYKQIIDASEDRGPMVGVQRALEEAKMDWVFVIACDMPFVSTRLIQEQANKRTSFDAVVPFVDDRPQPLFGFYAKTCLPMIEVQMQQGQRSMMRLLDKLDTCLVAEAQVKEVDPSLKSFISLDTVEQVKAMEFKHE